MHISCKMGFYCFFSPYSFCIFVNHYFHFIFFWCRNVFISPYYNEYMQYMNLWKQLVYVDKHTEWIPYCRILHNLAPKLAFFISPLLSHPASFEEVFNKRNELKWWRVKELEICVALSCILWLNGKILAIVECIIKYDYSGYKHMWKE